MEVQSRSPGGGQGAMAATSQPHGGEAGLGEKPRPPVLLSLSQRLQTGELLTQHEEEGQSEGTGRGGV